MKFVPALNAPSPKLNLTKSIYPDQPLLNGSNPTQTKNEGAK